MNEESLYEDSRLGEQKVKTIHLAHKSQNDHIVKYVNNYNQLNKQQLKLQNLRPTSAKNKWFLLKNYQNLKFVIFSDDSRVLFIYSLLWLLF